MNASGSKRRPSSLWDLLRKTIVLKARTKVLAIFALMFAGLFYANTVIFEQIRASSASIESQSRVMARRSMLLDTISCFSDIKYRFAILDNNLKKNSAGPPDANAEQGARCDLDKFSDDLEKLGTFSDEAGDIRMKYMIMRDLPRQAAKAYAAGKVGTGEKEMSKASAMVAGIDQDLGRIAAKIKRDSEGLSAHAFSEAEKFKKFPALFLLWGACGLALASVVILYNIFQPIESIISTMVSASQDPHNTKNYIIQHESGADEVGEVMLALNSLLQQVHEGFRSTEAAEQESAAAARQLDAVFNSVADGLITANADGEIVSLNKSVYGIFGYDRLSIKDKKIGDFFPPGTAMKYARDIQSFIDGGVGDLVNSGPKEVMGLRNGGGEIPIELSVTSIQQEDGRSVFVNVIRDITYRKDLERQLLQAQKMEALGSLSSGIAHEINTPAQYVRDNIKFLQKAFQAYDGFYKDVVKKETAEVEKKHDIAFFSAEAPQALAQSLEGVDRIGEIVSAIRGFSYPATEDIAHVDLGAVLKNTIIVTRNQWKPFAQMRTGFDENIPPVPCFPGKLTQVILNLIVNATHAIEEKSRGVADPENNFITLSTALMKKRVVIRISDTGCGIPKENMNRIFNPFFTTKEVGKGTGQGLSISYDIIVKKHGGTLTVESEPGRGATFIIELPMDIESARTLPKGGKITAV